MKALGEHIKQLRTRKNLTQSQLSNSVGKDRQSLQRLEAGNINPSLYYLYESADGLDTDLKTIVNFKVE